MSSIKIHDLNDEQKAWLIGFRDLTKVFLDKFWHDKTIQVKIHQSIGEPVPPEELWLVLRINKSVRILDYRYNIRDYEWNDGGQEASRRHSIGTSLFRLALSPDSTVERIESCEFIDGWTECIPFDEDLECLEEGASKLAHRCKVRRFDFCNQALEGRQPLSLSDVSTMLQLVSHRLPYLYDIGYAMNSHEWSILLSENQEKMKETATEDEKAQCQLYRDNVMMVPVWLERNQVGRALLHLSVKPTVPLSLWPTILAKAGNSKSPHFSYYSTPPLNGIFYLLKEAFKGTGPLVGAGVPSRRRHCKRGRDLVSEIEQVQMEYQLDEMSRTIEGLKKGE